MLSNGENYTFMYADIRIAQYGRTRNDSKRYYSILQTVDKVVLGLLS